MTPRLWRIPCICWPGRTAQASEHSQWLPIDRRRGDCAGANFSSLGRIGDIKCVQSKTEPKVWRAKNEQSSGGWRADLTSASFGTKEAVSMAAREVRVLLVDDHEVVRSGVRAILEARGGVQICAEASNARD